MLAINVMETQQRVWNGVTKDISYLRKILNEVYMLKFKVKFMVSSLGYNRTESLITACLRGTIGSDDNDQHWPLCLLPGFDDLPAGR